jgi:DNA polymerase III delta subunit
MPGRLSLAAARERIKSGEIEPLYLVAGDDEAGMSALAAELSESVDEEFRAFNVQRFYGSDSGVRLAAVLDAASTLPLLAARRVVLLLQADRLLTVRRRPRASDEVDEDEVGEGAEGAADSPATDLALLKAYAGAPHRHAAVAIFAPGLQRVFEGLAKDAALVVCEASFDVVRALAREHGVRIEPAAADLLRASAGGDAVRLRADTERVLLYAAGRTHVTRGDVAEVMGKPASAHTLWKDLANRNTAAALRQLALELDEGKVPYMLLGLLRSVAERTVTSRDLPRALDAVLRTDLALKTSGGEPRVLLERLVVELCGMGRAQ